MKNIMHHLLLNKLFGKTIVLFAASVLLFSQQAAAITVGDVYCIGNNSCAYDPTATRCDSSTTSDAATSSAKDNKLYVIGDSLTVGMRDSGNLKAKLINAGWSVNNIEATGGISIDASIPKINADSSKDVSSASTVLVGLGTNRSANDKKSIEAMISAIKDKAPDAQIVWINAYSTKTDYGDFNRTLESEVEAGKKVDKILDWSKEAQANASDYDLAGDSLGIHTGPSGYVKRSGWVTSGLGAPPSTNNPQSPDAKSGPLDKDVGASEFTDGQGYHSDNLKNTYSFAELSPAGTGSGAVTQETATNLGKLDYKQRVAITYKGKTVVAEKLDIGKGGAAIEGKRRDIDIHYDKTAQALGITDANSWSGVVHVVSVDNSTPLGPSADQITSSAPTAADNTATLLGCCPPISDGGASTTLTGSGNAEKVWNYFIGKGLTNVQAAAIMGNMTQESGFKPGAAYSGPVNSDAYGIAQWVGGRRANLEHFASSKGKPANDLGVQLDFLWSELSTGYKTSVLDPLKKETDLKKATDLWLRKFEAPCNNEPCYANELNKNRLPPAITWANKAKDGAGSTAPGTDTSVSSSTDSAACGGSAGGSTSIDGYKNPYRDVKQQNPLRIDMGVDYAGVGPIYAIGKGKVDVVYKRGGGSGWPGWGSSGTGGWVSYTLSDGPAAGKTVYFAENCAPTVSAGDSVTADTKICDLDGLSSAWSESGWAADKTTSWAAAHVEWSGNDSTSNYTAYGENFSDLLVKLGQKPGTKQPGARKLGALPAGWPQWK